ncbi:MAG: Fic family protein [Pseudomonadota bacterium]
MPFASKEFLADYAYLFLVDPSRLYSLDKKYASGKQYDFYEKEEPGYGLGILKGYCYAFSPELTNPMSHTAILGVHKATMAHSHECIAGEYKTNCNNFTLCLSTEKTCTSNVSLGGFLEFLNTSLLPPNSVHSVTFHCPKQGDIAIMLKESFELLNVDGTLMVRTMHQELIDAGYLDPRTLVPAPVVYEPSRDNPRIESALKQGGAVADLRQINYGKELFFIPAINSMPEDLVLDKKFNQTLVQKLDAIFESYHAAIEVAESEDEKLRVIVSHVQRISQLHPFSDGNTRVCYILLNRLLNLAGLNLALLFNPNRFDCFSAEENVDFVKQGQDYCSRLLLNSQTHIFEDDLQLARALKTGLRKIEVKPTPLSGDAEFSLFLNKFIEILENEQMFLKSQLSALSQAFEPMPAVGQYFNRATTHMFRYYLDVQRMLTAKAEFDGVAECEHAEKMIKTRFPGLVFFSNKKQGKVELIVPGVNLPENAKCLKEGMIRCGVMRST